MPQDIIDMYKYKNNLIIYDNNLLSEKDVLDKNETIEDVKNDIELIRYIDSNRALLLKGVNITRQDIE